MDGELGGATIGRAAIHRTDHGRQTLIGANY